MLNAAMHGEITADGAHVALIAAGTDWDIEEAAAALKHMTPAFTRSDPPGALIAPLSWPLAVQLAATFDGNEHGTFHPGKNLATWITAQAQQRAQARASGIPVPAGLEPRPYQLDGAAQIAAAGKFLLLDEAGTGKTVTTILGLATRHAGGIPVFPCVIVVPSWEVADNWDREIARWWCTDLVPDVGTSGGLPVVAHWGGAGRHDMAGTADVYLTTYATARLDAADTRGPLVKLKPAAVVCDECHYCKNEDAKQSQAVRRIARHASTVIALSGTPITRHTGDIWPVLAAMEPAAWPSRDRMVKRYCEKADTGYGEQIEGLKQLAEPEFRTAMLGSMRRVAKADVLPQLPPKVYSVRRTEIPPEWRRAYDTMAAQMLAELPDGGELPVMSTLAQLTRLVQLASSAADVTELPQISEGGLRKQYQVTLKAPSWKAEAMVRVLRERPGQQVVCFAASSQLTDIAGRYAEADGHKVGYVTGSETRPARRRALDAFAAGELDLICATAGAGGTGINELAVAGTAVFLERPWPLDQSMQAEDRLDRIGQVHDCVEIIDIVAKDTVDDRVRMRLREKAGQLADFVKDPRIVRGLLGGER